jgi:hypothetical protein
VRTVARGCFFEQHGISHFSRILFCVFGPKSFEGWPATATRRIAL